MNITFVKLAGSWFCHLPDYEGDVGDLVMVAGADVMLDILDNDNVGIITLELSEEPSDYVLEYYHNTADTGADYKITKLDTGWSMWIWLCKVTEYVFGKYPKKLYFKKV